MQGSQGHLPSRGHMTARAANLSSALQENRLGKVGNKVLGVAVGEAWLGTAPWMEGMGKITWVFPIHDPTME